MRFFSAARTVLALALFLPTLVHAETPAPDAEAPPATVLSRVNDWFANDWFSGWESGSTRRLMASPYTLHYSNSPEHRNVLMLGIESERSDGFVAGGTVFRNSFGQPSTYLFVGQRFDKVYGVDSLYTYLTGGLLYGYRPPYNHKVPLNIKGFSPGIVGSVGWQFTPVWSGQINVLGNSGLMFQVAVDLH